MQEISEGLATLEEPFGTVGSQVVRIGMNHELYFIFIFIFIFILFLFF